MKYCRKCGMLLEDTHERCIKCGTDVTLASNYSLYPPEIEASLKKDKEEKKSKTALIIVMVVVFTILIGLVGLVLWKMSSGGLNVETPAEEAPKVTEAVVEEVEEEVPEEPAEESVARVSNDNRDIKDDLGNYYVCAPQCDDAGNVILNTVYPEDLTQTEFILDTEVYSNTFPEVMKFIATDDDNSVRFTAISPQQLWHLKSEKKKSRTNERIPQYYMTFLAFDSADAYIDSLVKSSYPKAKKIELVSSGEVSDSVTASIAELSKSRKDYFLTGKIGDYAHLGEDTAYATMSSSYSALTYEYKITDASKEVLCCKFYVPVIANDLYYASVENGDMGNITEWYLLGIYGIETGNDMIYEEYEPQFDFFCANTVPTHMFYYTNAEYEKEIQQAISLDAMPDLLDGNKLKQLAAGYKPDSDVGDIRSGVEKFLNSYSPKTFVLDNLSIHTPDDISVAFYNAETNKLFVSTDENEYPGSGYEQLY